eukprot:764731-Hanusia_phi.AAC.1
MDRMLILLATSKFCPVICPLSLYALRRKISLVLNSLRSEHFWIMTALWETNPTAVRGTRQGERKEEEQTRESHEAKPFRLGTSAGGQ